MNKDINMKKMKPNIKKQYRVDKTKKVDIMLVK